MMGLSTAAEVALWILLFFVAIMSIAFVGALVGIAAGIAKLNQKVDVALEQVRPVVARTTEVLDTVQRVTMNVGERADHVLAKGEAITDSVAQTVDRTACIVEKVVTGPLINFSSVVAGVSRGFGAFSRGTRNGHAAHAATNDDTRSSNGHG